MRPGHVVVGRFEILSHAGSGGMGDVFRARDRVTGQDVALKTMRADLHDAARFEREAAILESIAHPGIVGHVGHGALAPEDDPSGAGMYLAMEWIDGEPLDKRLSRAPLGIADTVALLRALADALAEVHARRVVHRDLKPANVMLVGGEPERPKLIDFGIARALDATPLTRKGAIAGTPAYMAPEQIRGGDRVDVRADLFSLASVAYACLTGSPPFTGGPDLGVLVKIMLEDPPRLATLVPGVPDGLAELIARMHAKLPEARPEGGREVAAALARLVVGAPRPVRASVLPAMTRDERVLVSVVVAAPEGDAEATLARAEDEERRRAIADIAASHGVRADRLVGGAVVVSVHGMAASDQAASAARAALALRAVLPDHRMALATGRGSVAGRLPVGEVIDRAMSLLGAGAGVPLDALTVGLLPPRFDVATASDGSALRLLAERAAPPRADAVLGRRAPLVGRAKEHALLDAIAEESRAEESPRLVVLAAPLGLGKTRLLVSHEEMLLRASVTVLRADGHPLRAGRAFGLLGESLAASAGLDVARSREERRARLAAWLSRSLTGTAHASAADALTELLSVGPDEPSAAIAAARADPIVMGDLVRAALEEWLLAELTNGPVAFLLDDVQWADASSVRWLETMTRRAAGPLHVVLAGRPELRERFPALAERASHEIKLGPLSATASRELAAALLDREDRPADSSAIERVAGRAQGSPLFCEELARAEAAGRGDDVPDTVAAMMEARLGMLEPEARRVLRAASVLGPVAWDEAVAHLLGGSAQRASALEWIELLIDREILMRRSRSRFTGTEELGFRHGLACDAAYAMLTETDRIVGHRLAGEWLERAGERDGMIVAHHFERAGLPRRAAAGWASSAASALEAGELDAAIERAARGLASDPPPDIAGRLHLVAAEAHAWQGELEKAALASTAALEAIDPRIDLPRHAAALAELAEARFRLGRIDEIPPLTARIEALAASSGVGPALAALAHRVAGLLAFAGREVDAARALLARASEEVRSDAGVRAWGHVLDAIVAQREGDVGRHLAERRLASGAFVEAGLGRWSLFEDVNLGFALLEVGVPAEAEQALVRALALAERLGLASVAATARQNLGLAVALLGRRTEAIAIEQQAVTELAEQGNTRMEGAARTYLARILLDAGETEAAEREATQASAMLEAAQSTLRGLALAVLALARLARGALDGAGEAAEAAMLLVRAPEGVEEGEALVRLAHASVLSARRDGATVSAWEDAIARIERRAAAISDATLRAAFLAMPEHRATLERSPLPR